MSGNFGTECYNTYNAHIMVYGRSQGCSINMYINKLSQNVKSLVLSFDLYDWGVAYKVNAMDY